MTARVSARDLARIETLFCRNASVTRLASSFACALYAASQHRETSPFFALPNLWSADSQSVFFFSDQKVNTPLLELSDELLPQLGLPIEQLEPFSGFLDGCIAVPRISCCACHTVETLWHHHLTDVPLLQLGLPLELLESCVGILKGRRTDDRSACQKVHIFLLMHLDDCSC